MIEILQGDCRDVLKALPDESVQCVVTSPPYWGLRDYGTAKWEGGDVTCDHSTPRSRGDDIEPTDKQGTSGGSRPNTQMECRCGAKRVDNQIGLEKTPQEYVATMVQVFREVRRVLKTDGTCWLNLGDSYSGSGRGAWNVSDEVKDAAGVKETYRPKVRPIGDSARDNAVTKLAGEERVPPGLKPKDLVGIPWRVAFALQDDGWWLRSDIIWHKPNPMPESVTDRPTKAHEYIFLLTKSSKYFYDADAIAEPASYAMHAQMEQGYEGEGQKDYEANGVQNPSDVKRRIIENAKRKSWKGSEFHTGKTAIHQQGRSSVKRGDFNGKTNELEGREAFRAFTITRNKRTVWTVPSSPYRDAHFATFPPALISPCILAGTKPGDTVLDPFGGSGTTGQVALGCGRKAILIELNPEYHKMIEKRTQVLGFQF